MELLKQGDFVIVWEPNFDNLTRGIVVANETEGSQVFVVVVRHSMISSNYYDRKFIIKIV